MLKQATFERARQVLPPCVAIVLALALLLPAAGAQAGSTAGKPELATVVRCNPTTAIGVVGVTNAVVDMYIEDVVGLYGADLQISYFNTTIAQVVDQVPATTSIQIEPLSDFLQPDFIVRRVADNMAGTIHYAATQTDPTLPVDGSGPVARITFQGLQAGTFTMTWGPIELSTIDGRIIPFTAQPCTITFIDPPLAITLASFEASAQADHVLVAWETVSESGNRGFNLHRGTSPAGPDQQLNATLIPSQSQGSSSGFVYTWEDRTDLVPDTVYYYWLEDVSLAGVTTRHGPVSVDYAGPTAVALNGVSANPAAGMALPWLWVIVIAGAALGVSRMRR